MCLLLCDLVKLLGNMSVCLGRSYKKDCNHAEDFLFKIMHRLTGFEGNTKAFFLDTRNYLYFYATVRPEEIV